MSRYGQTRPSCFRSSISKIKLGIPTRRVVGRMQTSSANATVTSSPQIEPFDVYTSRYEKWFEKHDAVYSSELNAIQSVLPEFKCGVEIGVGTGRFSEPFGIQHGIDPARNALRFAKVKRIEVVNGVGEALPYLDQSFDLVLIVTSICFFSDSHAVLGEAFRILKHRGSIVIGFVEKDSALGMMYQERREASPFYTSANFYRVNEVVSMLSRSSFADLTFAQTVFKGLSDIREVEPVKQGYGEGSFVVIRAMKSAL